MAYPALTDLATFIVVLAVGISAAFIFSKVLKLHGPKLGFADKKKQMLLSLLVFAVGFLFTFGIYDFYDKVWVRATLTADPIYVLRAAIAIGLLVLPTAAALRLSKQGLADVALTRKNLGKNVVFGGLVSVVLVAVLAVLSPWLGGGFAGFSVPTIYLLFSYVVIALGEEAVFRGYIQTRLVASGGSILGVGSATVLYALYNIPLGFFCYGGNVASALVYGAWRLSTGLVYGYAFHKSQSIASSVIVHIFLVWGGLLFSLYL